MNKKFILAFTLIFLVLTIIFTCTALFSANHICTHHNCSVCSYIEAVNVNERNRIAASIIFFALFFKIFIVIERKYIFEKVLKETPIDLKVRIND